jgi:hypothetical protein
VNFLGGHSIGHSKQKSVYVHVFHYGFRDITVYSSKSVNTFSKIPPSTSLQFATRVRTWRVAPLYGVQCTVQ